MTSPAPVTQPRRPEVVPDLPGELYIETTNRCNLRCRTCPQYWGMDEAQADLSPAQVTRILGYFPLHAAALSATCIPACCSHVQSC